MPLKNNVARELPVILIDSSDFLTGLTGKVFGDVICKYRKDGATSWTTKTIDTNNWNEIDNGHYTIDFTAGEMDTNGLFEYIVIVSGAIDYSGLFEIRNNTNDDLDSDLTNIETKIDTIDTNVDDLQLDVSDVLVDTGNIETKVDSIITTLSTLISDIWSYTTRTLTSFGTLIADIWAYSTRTLTSFGTIIADIWAYATRTLTAGTKDTEIDSIKSTVEDTNTKVDNIKQDNFNGEGV